MDIIDKNTKVFDKVIMALFRPYVFSALCNFLLSISLSVFTGNIIGQDALAIIGLMTPIMLMDECLHELFGMATSINMAKLKVDLSKKYSDRYFASILVIITISFGLLVTILLLFSNNIILFFTKDPNLIFLMKQYYYPIVLLMPIGEILLCTERAYFIDGRAKYFSMRGIVTTILNVSLNVLLIVILKWGMIGVSVSYVVSTLGGYIFVIAHPFSKKCTVYPDFSILKNKKEFLSNIEMAVNVGKEYAPWVILNIFSSGLINKLISIRGGSIALAIMYIVGQADSLLFFVSNSLAQSYNLVINVLIGSKDNYEFKQIVDKTIRFALILGAVITVGLFIFAKQICLLFGAEMVNINLYINCFRISTISYLVYVFVFISRQTLTSINKLKEVRTMAFITDLGIIFTIMMGSFFGLYGIFIGSYYIIFIAAIYVFFLYKKGKLYLNIDKEEGLLKAMAFELNDENISKASEEIESFLFNTEFGKGFSEKIALLIEESCICIKEVNIQVKKIDMYIRLRLVNEKLTLIICDNGKAVDFLGMISEAKKDDIEKTSEHILKNFSQKIEYERIVDINFLKLILNS